MLYSILTEIFRLHCSLFENHGLDLEFCLNLTKLPFALIYSKKSFFELFSNLERLKTLFEWFFNLNNWKYTFLSCFLVQKHWKNPFLGCFSFLIEKIKRFWADFQLEKKVNRRSFELKLKKTPKTCFCLFRNTAHFSIVKQLKTTFWGCKLQRFQKLVFFYSKTA